MESDSVSMVVWLSRSGRARGGCLSKYKKKLKKRERRTEVSLLIFFQLKAWDTEHVAGRHGVVKPTPSRCL